MYAAFIKESRMKFLGATNLNRKSGTHASGMKELPTDQVIH